ncbi:MAG: TIGR02530 family flagellar biosynthesis protein [Ignavibacteriaceae bacterium]
MIEMNGIHVPFVPIEPGKEISKANVQDSSTPFKAIFQEELEKLKFSNHALKRLENRNISLSESDLGKIRNAVEKAQLKGAKDSLVMMKDTAFIVNIPNKTVVTAMPLNNSEENIFTNIDSVVFA